MKTIIALDGIISMDHVFPKVKEVLKESFPRSYDTLNQNHANGAF
jgi:hypothetical protein